MARSTKNFLVYAIRDRFLKRNASIYLNGHLIDIGCGDKPYEDLLAPYVSEHIGLDITTNEIDNSKIDVFGSATAIPVVDSSFDSALCLAMFQLLTEPEDALRECLRVLKPGGFAIFEMPFIWHKQGQYDFSRYSDNGLRYMFEKAGFNVVKIEALSGMWVTVGEFLVYYLYRFDRAFLRTLHIIDAIALLIQAISYLLDQIDRSEFSKNWTWAYMVIAAKSGES